MHECTTKGAQAVRKLAPQTGRGKSSTVMETLPNSSPRFRKSFGHRTQYSVRGANESWHKVAVRASLVAF